MPKPIQGIHHITGMAGDAQRNLDFYTRQLGMRLVKRTVNFDDPGTYHFYFADEIGHPGTVLTFFPWGDARKGRRGAGQVAVTGFRVPQGSMGFWADQLERLGITASGPHGRFDDEVLAFADPDGFLIELTAEPGTGSLPGDDQLTYPGGGIPAEHAIRGFAAPTLYSTNPAETANLLTNVFGFREVGQSGKRVRFTSGEGAGTTVDVEDHTGEDGGRMGAGVMHHIAWRATDDADQLEWRERLTGLGFEVTPVMDRQYFHSIYFREPGGVLFEIATDPPGFLYDESVETLGSALRLPPWLEPKRDQIEQLLPPLVLPQPDRQSAD